MLTRANLVAYLANIYQPIAKETATMPSDTTDGFGLPIDATLRRLGVAQADLVTGTVADDREEQSFALAEYYSLRRFYALLATRVDLPASGMMSPRSQMFTNVGKLLEAAEKRCAALGYPVSDVADMYLVRIGLDYIEPEVTHG